VVLLVINARPILTPLLESKDSQIREATRKIGDLEEAILDYDQTVGQFRELVTQLSR
jgi:dynactin 1